ncbi:hypothetical protein [Streptomyces violaceusniger]|uniref:hypothetical protein n=1 Tax=Streptomyces violaceusniger TaxID=68280 RepID=UPI0026D7D489
MTRLRQVAATCALSAALSSVFIAPAVASSRMDSAQQAAAPGDNRGTSAPASVFETLCGYADATVPMREKPSTDAPLINRILQGTRMCGDVVTGKEYTACGHTSKLWLKFPPTVSRPQVGYSAAWCFH